MINRDPYMRQMAYKDTFAKLTKLAVKMNPEGFDFIPPTFTLPNELEQFKAYKRSHPKATFIAKPADGSGGDSIILFKNLNQLS